MSKLSPGDDLSWKKKIALARAEMEAIRASKRKHGTKKSMADFYSKSPSKPKR